MEPVNILVTVDENYLSPLRVMLKSLFLNNSRERFHLYLLHGGIPGAALADLGDFCACHGAALYPCAVGEDAFADAPVFRYLTKAMYYRLLAFRLLPAELEKVLYLDPDILVINPIRPLYDTDLEGYLYGACIHTGLTKFTGTVNKVRLNAYEAEGYYNSGVLLMNLQAQRQTVQEEEIYRYVAEHKLELILPDQDVLNGLYGNRIKPLDDSLYNYDTNHYETYRMLSAGKKDAGWVMENTVILHFCGKNKPWLKPARNRFGILHRHYAALAGRDAPGQKNTLAPKRMEI